MSMMIQRLAAAATLSLGLALAATPASAQVSDQTDLTAATDQAAAETAGESPAIVDTNRINATASAVHEEALFEALRPGEPIAGRISIPDNRAAQLIKPENRDWAHRTLDTIHWLMLALIVVTLLGLVAFYLYRGRIRIHSGWSGQRITRFGAIDRFAHWLMAISFILLALTGLNLVLGRSLLPPLIGDGAFGWLMQTGKVIHNFIGWPFMAGLVLAFLLWVRRNIPYRRDVEWLKQAGGLFSKSGKHIPSGKFNAGQKLIFWSVVIGGGLLSFTGIMLLFPGEVSAGDWQWFQMVHAAAAGILSAVILAHIYIGSVGMEGAFSAMGSGEVDLNWAKEHHSLWVDEVRREGDEQNRPVAPATTPAE